jgi:hypothetical protein
MCSICISLKWYFQNIIVVIFPSISNKVDVKGKRSLGMTRSQRTGQDNTVTDLKEIGQIVRTKPCEFTNQMNDYHSQGLYCWLHSAVLAPLLGYCQKSVHVFTFFELIISTFWGISHYELGYLKLCESPSEVARLNCFYPKWWSGSARTPGCGRVLVVII